MDWKGTGLLVLGSSQGACHPQMKPDVVTRYAQEKLFIANSCYQSSYQHFLQDYEHSSHPVFWTVAFACKIMNLKAHHQISINDTILFFIMQSLEKRRMHLTIQLNWIELRLIFLQCKDMVTVAVDGHYLFLMVIEIIVLHIHYLVLMVKNEWDNCFVS